MAVMGTVGASADGVRLRALIVVLWRAGPRIGEALAVAEDDPDLQRGAVLVGRRRPDTPSEVGMDRWAWAQLDDQTVIDPDSRSDRDRAGHRAGVSADVDEPGSAEAPLGICKVNDVAARS